MEGRLKNMGKCITWVQQELWSNHYKTEVQVKITSISYGINCIFLIRVRANLPKICVSPRMQLHSEIWVPAQRRTILCQYGENMNSVQYAGCMSLLCIPIIYWYVYLRLLLWGCIPGLILSLRSANERRSHFVTTSLIGWVQAWGHWIRAVYIFAHPGEVRVSRTHKQCVCVNSLLPSDAILWRQHIV